MRNWSFETFMASIPNLLRKWELLYFEGEQNSSLNRGCPKINFKSLSLECQSWLILRLYKAPIYDSFFSFLMVWLYLYDKKDDLKLKKCRIKFLPQNSLFQMFEFCFPKININTEKWGKKNHTIIFENISQKKSPS